MAGIPFRAGAAGTLLQAFGGPARTALGLAGAGLADDPKTAAFLAQLGNVAPTPKVPEWEQIATRVAEAAEQVMRGARDLDSALAALDADVDRILEKRRWMLGPGRRGAAEEPATPPANATVEEASGSGAEARRPGFCCPPPSAPSAFSLPSPDRRPASFAHRLRHLCPGRPANTPLRGRGNYVRLLRDPLFWKVMRNTPVFVLIGVPLTLMASLGGALLVNSKLARLRGLFRTIFFAPVVTTLVAVAVVFRYLYHPRYGLINQMLGLIGLPPIDWLGAPTGRPWRSRCSRSGAASATRWSSS